mgnify:CR=1 FL=1
MDAKEYLQEQIHLAGEMTRNSTIRYYDDDTKSYCPYCGGPQKQHLLETGVFKLECNCAGYKNEELTLNEIDKLEAEIVNLQTQLSAFKTQLKKQALESGTIFCAKHYMELKPQRDAFDAEIEKMTK